MPHLENARLSTARSEDSRESSSSASSAEEESMNAPSSSSSAGAASTSPATAPIPTVSSKAAALLSTEIFSLTATLSSVSNEAARIVTRKHWRKCLIGTERDQSFLVRAILKHSTPHVYARAMEDYGTKMLEAASEECLDRALELRLQTIDADRLVAMLAKAKRLGYDEQDEVDEEEDVVPARDTPSSPPVAAAAVTAAAISQETVQPSSFAVRPNVRPDDAVVANRSDLLLEERNRNALAAAAAAAAAAQFSHAPYQQPIGGSYAQNMNLPTRRKAKDPTSRKFVCPDCTASFAQQGGLTYHMDRKVCHRPAPQFKWFCQKCGKGFTTSGGKLYHEQNKVCGTHETANATPPPSGLQPTPAAAESIPSPQLADGPKPSDLPGRPRSAQAPQVPPPPLHQVAHDRLVQYNAVQNLDRTTVFPHSQTSSSPFQRIGPQSHSATPLYPTFRAKIGPFLQTPPMKSSPASGHTPGEMSSLDPATQAELNAKIATEVQRFERKCRELPDTLSAVDREDAITREKRGHATRKSQIRKKYGIQIRTSKFQQANFVNLPSLGDAPILAPISRIDVYRAPAAAMATTYSISTPSSMEYSRRHTHPPMENPDAKRRKLENSVPIEQLTKTQDMPTAQNVPDAGSRSSIDNIQSPEILEVDGGSKPDQQISHAFPQTSSVDKLPPPKKVKWETLPKPTATAPAPSSPTSALRDISNKGPPRSATPIRRSQTPEKKLKSAINNRGGNGDAEPVVIVSSTSRTEHDAPATATRSSHSVDDNNYNDDDDADEDEDEEEEEEEEEEEDSDVDLDEDIPARLPPGVVPRRRSARMVGRSGAVEVASSVSVSPGPASAAMRIRMRRDKKKKRIGKGLFGSSSSRRGTSEEEDGGRRTRAGSGSSAATVGGRRSSSAGVGAGAGVMAGSRAVVEV